MLLAQELNLLKLGTPVLEGAKWLAHANKRKAMSYGRMQQEQARLRQEVQACSERAECAVASEDEVYGAQRHGVKMPQEDQFRQQRLEQIEAAQPRVEERQKQFDLEVAGVKTTMAMPSGRDRKVRDPSTGARLARCLTSNKSNSPILRAGS